MSPDIKNSALKLSKVVLYKHGIGYFERRGEVTGPTKIDLVCGPDEIDDMLKSLVALTTSGGRVDAITYDSSKTLQSRLAEFGFDLTRTEGLCGLLAQMKGIPVTVTVSGETVSGRVLGLDETQQVVRDSLMREKLLTLYNADSTFKQIPLTSISAIRVDDESMAQEMRQQLELLFQNAKKKDRKALSVALSDAGEHNLLIAYSIPSPIWKTSYRLVMNSSGKTLLQGMAIVDNVQEEDWNDVQIVLVSAAPISFIQPLYDPVQPFRRTIAAQGVTSSGPVTAEQAQMQTRARKQVAFAPPAPGSPAPAAMAFAAAAAPSYDMSEMRCEEGAATGQGMFSLSAFADEVFDSVSGQQLSVEATQSGEQFEYKISKPVTVPRNSSALIPIVQETVEGERISLFNAQKNSKFPFAAIRFKNTTGLTLEGGPVTIMESDAYAGEALIDTVKPNDVRFMLYAVDQALPVVIRAEQENRPIWRVRAAGGALYLDYKSVTTKLYQVDNLADRQKVLYIEHPLTPNWKIVSEVKPTETTENFYRFSFPVEPMQNYELKVSEETETYQCIWLSDPNNLDVQRLKWLCSQNFLDKQFVDFLQQVIKMRAEIVQIRTQLNQKKMNMEEHARDQKRARDNLQSLGANSEKYRRLVDSAEDKIQQERKEMAELMNKLTELETEFASKVNANLISELARAT